MKPFWKAVLVMYTLEDWFCVFVEYLRPGLAELLAGAVLPTARQWIDIGWLGGGYGDYLKIALARKSKKKRSMVYVGVSCGDAAWQNKDVFRIGQEIGSA